MVSALLPSSLYGSRCASLSASSSRRSGSTRCQPCRRQQRQPVQALFGGGNKEGGGKNPFADMGALMENMKKAQEVVQVEAAKVQEELGSTTFEGFSEDETVCVTMTGNQQPVGCDITDEAYAMGAEAVAARVTEAMKDSHDKSTAAMKNKMRGLASSLGLPGQF